MKHLSKQQPKWSGWRGLLPDWILGMPFRNPFGSQRWARRTVNRTVNREPPVSEAAQSSSPPAAQPYQWSRFDWFCLWYPPGWLILFNRHWQHYHADPDGWNGLEYGLFLIPGGFYLALLLRWLRLGGRAPRSVAPVVDLDYQQAFRREVLRPIVHHYFRAELQRVDLLPATGGLIVVLNHAGMCFPWDMISLGVLLSEQRNWLPLPVSHSLFFDHPWLRWWLPAGWAESLGGVRAERPAVETAVAALRSVSAAASPEPVLLYAPEGWRGLAKGWRQRHRLQVFDANVIRFSHRYQVPILPVVCLGNEFLHPWTWNVRRLARWFGMPLFPVSGLLLLFLLFPSMGVWANRTRLRYVLQPVQQPWQQLPSQPDRATLYAAAQQLRQQLQQQLDQLIDSKATQPPQAAQPSPPQ